MTLSQDRPRLVLASASPARLSTLRRAGLDPEVVVSGVDEAAVPPGTPGQTAQRLAVRKAAAVSDRIAAELESSRGRALVLGCDSLLELDGRAHGKPADTAEARTRWRAMRGRRGVLHTGHCLIETASGRRVEALGSTEVRFAQVDDADIDAYLATGEPLAVAGAFTLDGYGAAFVDGITGDPHNVIGVSLPLLRRLLGDLDVVWTRLWAR